MIRRSLGLSADHLSTLLPICHELPNCNDHLETTPWK